MVLNLYKYKAKSLGKKTAQPANAANRILKNVTIALPLEYLSNFFKSIEMSLINCEVELKFKWTKYCDLSSAGNDNEIANAANANRIIFTIKDTKLHVPLVTLSERYNQKLSKLLSRGFKRSVYWSEYKTISYTKNAKNEFRFFLESTFVGVNRLAVLVYSNEDAVIKDLKPKGIFYQKELLRIIMPSSMEKAFMTKQLSQI